MPSRPTQCHEDCRNRCELEDGQAQSGGREAGPGDGDDSDHKGPGGGADLVGGKSDPGAASSVAPAEPHEAGKCRSGPA